MVEDLLLYDGDMLAKVKKIWTISKCIDCYRHRVKDGESYCFDRSQKRAWRKIAVDILSSIPNWCPLENYEEEEPVKQLNDKVYRCKCLLSVRYRNIKEIYRKVIKDDR
jgi:hypothetical protein